MAGPGMNTVKNILSALAGRLPVPMRQWLRKRYYPGVLRRFTDRDWPASAVVRRLVRPGRRAVDVGANIGCVTLLLSRWVMETGRVYSFEPVPDTYAVLAHNVRKLGLRNVELFNCGLSSVEERARMLVPAYASGAENLYESRLVQGEASDAGRYVDVQLRRLDDCLADTESAVDFIKVDVEAHELEMVRGAEDIIRRFRPALFIEVDGDPDAPETSAAELFRLLESCGYAACVQEGDSVALRRPGRRAPDYFFLQPGHLDKLGVSR
ncbi:MAG: FkbM family methyltransferase [Phycisphaerae bacterium]|nr:FkbM family methyltransferase [Phycisphaerae bacterium]